MDEERDLLNESIDLAFEGLQNHDLGTEEREQAFREFAEFNKIHNDRFTRYDNSELEREKLEKEADIEKEKIKADERKDRRNVFVKIISLVGVLIVSALTLLTDTDNWIGRGSRKGSAFIQKFLKL